MNEPRASETSRCKEQPIAFPPSPDRSFRVAHFSIAVDQAWQTAGFILTRSVSDGSRGTLPSTQKRNPSLTQRVGIVTNAQLQNRRFRPARTSAARRTPCAIRDRRPVRFWLIGIHARSKPRSPVQQPKERPKSNAGFATDSQICHSTPSRALVVVFSFSLPQPSASAELRWRLRNVRCG